jgi:putative copper resistance protein D
MSALAAFFSTLLEGLVVIAYACIMGGLAWSMLLLRSQMSQPQAQETFARHSMGLLRWGAFGMATLQLARLATYAWLLAATFQRSPFPDYFFTLQCQAGLSRALCAGAVATVGLWLERHRGAPWPWGVMGGLVLLLSASGAWSSHAVGRDESRFVLMAVTALHQLAVAGWLGGLIQLGGFWRQIRRQPYLKALWPELLRRFAWIGGPAILGIITTGVLLARTYIGTWQDLIGTDYGAMVIIKLAFLGGSLGLAAHNFYAARGGPTTMHIGKLCLGPASCHHCHVGVGFANAVDLMGSPLAAGLHRARRFRRAAQRRGRLVAVWAHGLLGRAPQ